MMKEIFLQLYAEADLHFIGFVCNTEFGRYYFELKGNQITVTTDAPFKYTKDDLYLLVLREVVAITHISIC